MAARSSARPRALAGVLAVVVLTSCTLTKTTVDDCTVNADCRDAFGPGSICGSAGLCEKPPANPRCTTTFPTDVFERPEAYPGVLLLGVLMDRSVETQTQRENAVRLAVKEVNDQQGLDGRRFAAVLCDIAQNPQYDALSRTDAAVAAGRYLADVIGVPAIVGPSSSTDALAVYDALKASNVLVISPSATSPSITGVDTKTPTDEAPGLFWRTAPPDTLQGAAIVRYLTQQSPAPSNVALIHEKGAYGDSLAQVFRAGFETGGRTVAPAASFDNSSARNEAILNAGASGAPYVLFLSSQTADAVACLNAAVTAPGYDTARVFLTDSAANRDLLTGAAGASALFPRVFGSRPQVPSGRTFDLFKLSFQTEFRVDANAFSFVAHSYDAAWLVMYGTASSLRREGSVTGAGIARGLRKIVASGPEVQVTPGNWKQIADAISSGSAVNLAGASGTLDYDPSTEETSALIEIWKISADGQSIEVAETIDPR